MKVLLWRIVHVHKNLAIKMRAQLAAMLPQQPQFYQAWFSRICLHLPHWDELHFTGPQISSFTHHALKRPRQTNQFQIYLLGQGARTVEYCHPFITSVDLSNHIFARITRTKNGKISVAKLGCTYYAGFFYHCSLTAMKVKSQSPYAVALSKLSLFLSHWYHSITTSA